MSPIEQHQLCAVLAAIPPGAWMSHADVARACGGTDDHARWLGRRLLRDAPPGAHRVLCADGSIGGPARRDAPAVRRRLEAEGLEFAGGRADQRRRLRVGACARAAASGAVA